MKSKFFPKIIKIFLKCLALDDGYDRLLKVCTSAGPVTFMAIMHFIIMLLYYTHFKTKTNPCVLINYWSGNDVANIYIFSNVKISVVNF